MFNRDMQNGITPINNISKRSMPVASSTTDSSTAAAVVRGASSDTLMQANATVLHAHI